ncbi:hypothetical protein NPIL_178461 [Nephila pilipes]|uniref:Uncharacterized protein n=1 Tax=Nephila pilipes TaxID=299642 RepID=A0A8X6J8G4_NEPPI|nr:hypothetical protein NPIL_178461 [Nephila pilipes]
MSILNEKSRFGVNFTLRETYHDFRMIFSSFSKFRIFLHKTFFKRVLSIADVIHNFVGHSHVSGIVNRSLVSFGMHQNKRNLIVHVILKRIANVFHWILNGGRWTDRTFFRIVRRTGSRSSRFCGSERRLTRHVENEMKV